MPTEIHTIWRTAKACCEVAVRGPGRATLLLWIGSVLVYTEAITTFNEAMMIATELRVRYA